MKTYDHDMFDSYSTWDKVFDDIRSGVVKLGETVKVYDIDEGKYFVGIAGLSAGNPCVFEKKE
jgi:hypothetical protein